MPNDPSHDPGPRDDSEHRPEPIPARMLNEYVYCPRLYHLEYVQREWAESADTLAGVRDHRRVDVPKGDLPSAIEVAGYDGEARSVELEAPEAGIVAKLDLVELRDGTAVPVDYKHGRAPSEEIGVWEPDRIQVGAQALILRENGYRCDEAVVYYVASRRRVAIPVDDVLMADVRRVIEQARAAATAETVPPPLVDSPKCPRCSLVGICLPDETNALLEGEPGSEEDDATDDPDADAGSSSRAGTPIRRLYPTRDEALPLYVQSAGSRVGKDGEVLSVVDREGAKTKVRLIDVSQVALFGNVQISSSAISALSKRDVPICHFGFGGWFVGITHGIGPRNARVRVPQYRHAASPEMCLALARGFVVRKIKNCRTLLRRNGRDVDRSVLDDLERTASAAAKASSLDSLLGFEGTAARTYFGAFSSMLKGTDVSAFDLQARNRRPPRDPINALLSLAYSVLSRDWTIALLSVGLDPFLGFYHQPRNGRAALALDLMEEFRPLIGDSVVIQVVNNGEVAGDDFVRRGPAVALNDSGRKKFFLAYERRMAQEVRHPLFGYELSYRRLLEVQARLFARHLTGELPSYDGIRTR